MRKVGFVLVAALALALVLGVAVSAQDAPEISIVLKWVPQAQFAGYFAAEAQGYYEEEGLNVTIIPAGVDINPQQLLASGEAQFVVDWMGNALATKEAGGDLINIAQIYQRSGMRQITWADSGLTSFEDLGESVVGVWCCGNEFPTYAALTKAGFDVQEMTDNGQIAQQAFDMNAFLNREIDAGSAMTYNELAQVLETVAEDGTFPLYTMEDLNVLDFNDFGTAMLEDGIYARSEWLAEEGNEEIAIQFLRATFRGWAFCRDYMDECVESVLAAGPTLGVGHQTWQANEVNRLIWPSENGIGILDAAAFDTTHQIALDFGVIQEAIEGDGVMYRTDLAQAALDSLASDMADLDTVGADFEAAEVEVTPNGE
ncbi:MAG: ABC transporter substrate-binding protein [Anaerolineae bacterium]|nr:ABC transporter substrate-binding protein [Anaerolineae bacterium]